MIPVFHKDQALGNGCGAGQKSEFTRFVWDLITQLGCPFLTCWQRKSVVVLWH